MSVETTRQASVSPISTSAAPSKLLPQQGILQRFFGQDISASSGLVADRNGAAVIGDCPPVLGTSSEFVPAPSTQEIPSFVTKNSVPGHPPVSHAEFDFVKDCWKNVSLTNRQSGQINAGIISTSNHNISFSQENRQSGIVCYRCLFRRRCVELTGSVFETDSEEEMTVHLRSVHMNWLPVVCAVCGTHLATKNHLRTHFLSRHQQYGSPAMNLIHKNEEYHSRKNLCKEYLLECELSRLSNETGNLGSSDFLPPPQASSTLLPTPPQESWDTKKEKEEESSRCSSETSEQNLTHPLQQGRQCNLCDPSKESALTLFFSNQSKREHAEKHLIAEGTVSLTVKLNGSDPVMLDMLRRCFNEEEKSAAEKELRKRKSERNNEDAILEKFLKTENTGEVKKEPEDEREKEPAEPTPDIPEKKVTRSQAEKNLIRKLGIEPSIVAISVEDKRIAEEILNREGAGESLSFLTTSVCRLCNKVTTNQFSAHAQTHMDEKKFNCTAQGCRYGNNSRKLMERHLKTSHPHLNVDSILSREEEVGKLLEQKRKTCFPDLIRRQKWELNTGVKEATETKAEGDRKGAVCRKCGDSVLEEKFGDHVRRSHFGKFHCVYCKDFSSKLRIGIQTHVRQRHSSDYYIWRYRMEEMEEEAVQEIAAECFPVKEEAEDGKGKRICQMCQKSFARNPVMHVRFNHMNARMFKCLSCGLGLDSKEKIQIHVVTTPGCLPAAGPGFLMQRRDYALELKKQMKFCFPNYVSKSELRKKTKMKSSKKKEPDRKETSVCSNWVKRTDSCMKCGKVLNSTGRRTHIYVSHLKTKKVYGCPLCPYNSKYSLNEVRNHIRRKHPSKRRVQPVDHRARYEKMYRKELDACFPLVDSSGEVKKKRPASSGVAQTQPKGGRPLEDPDKCQECGIFIKTFRSSHVYIWHLKKPVYVCPVCGKSDKSSRGNLLQHIEHVHKGMNPKPKVIDNRRKYQKEYSDWYSRCFSRLPITGRSDPSFSSQEATGSTQKKAETSVRNTTTVQQGEKPKRGRGRPRKIPKEKEETSALAGPYVTNIPGVSKSDRVDKCQKCKILVHRNHRAVHVYKNHLKEDIFKCPFCDRSDKAQRYKIKIHIRDAHSSSADPIDLRGRFEPAIRTLFDECFPLKRIIQTAPLNSCSSGREPTKTEEPSGSTTVDRDFSVYSGRKVCRLCDVMILTPSDGELHLRQSHVPQQYQCKTGDCRFEAPTKDAILKHVFKEHHNAGTQMAYKEYSAEEQSEILRSLQQDLLQDAKSGGEDVQPRLFGSCGSLRFRTKNAMGKGASENQ